ncbi:MAG: pqqE [Caulobacteraceae bacterium]|nr:pqqE [Caulobacteraceae bacterium]
MAVTAPAATLEPPVALIAEITHRCPLSCAYCSNPLELERSAAELGTSDWLRVIEEAAALGVLHLHFTGGEPLARRDLATLVRHAAALQLYTNLITSGVQLDDRAMLALAEAGIDHIQLSFQDVEPERGDASGGLKGGHARKLAAAARIVAAQVPLTLNFVVHRGNIDRIPAMIALGERLGASRIEIAHVQYHGWALLNRASLLPTAEQLAVATAGVGAARARLGSRIPVDYVLPDYFATRPKACMGGWGRRAMNISPSGKALPCHAAESLPGFDFPSVRDTSLGAIWNGSEAFARFRGTDWAPEPCRSCKHLEADLGGCRCQAFALTGEAARTDPACKLSPDHHIVRQAIADAVAANDLQPRRIGLFGRAATR